MEPRGGDVGEIEDMVKNGLAEEVASEPVAPDSNIAEDYFEKVRSRARALGADLIGIPEEDINAHYLFARSSGYQVFLDTQETKRQPSS